MASFIEFILRPRYYPVMVLAGSSWPLANFALSQCLVHYLSQGEAINVYREPEEFREALNDSSNNSVLLGYEIETWGELDFLGEYLKLKTYPHPLLLVSRETHSRGGTRWVSRGSKSFFVDCHSLSNEGVSKFLSWAGLTYREVLYAQSALPCNDASLVNLVNLIRAIHGSYLGEVWSGNTSLRRYYGVDFGKPLLGLFPRITSAYSLLISRLPYLAALADTLSRSLELRSLAEAVGVSVPLVLELLPHAKGRDPSALISLYQETLSLWEYRDFPGMDSYLELLCWQRGA